MDTLRFWNTQKRQLKTFSDSQGNIKVSEISVFSNSHHDVRVFVSRRNVYKIIKITDNGITEQKSATMKIKDVHAFNIFAQAAHWNPVLEQQVAVGLADSHVILQDVAHDKCLIVHQASIKEKTKSRSVTCLQWIDKDRLVYGTKDPLIKIWDVRVDREPTISIYNNEGVHDIKFDPFNEYQFACASENHSVSLYDTRNPSKRTFQFSAHENRTLKCEWNPRVRNRLATSGHSNIKIWDLEGYNNQKLKEIILIPTRNCAYSMKWCPENENLLASHTHASRLIDIWDINHRFRPYRHFEENTLDSEVWSNQTKLVIHWNKEPHMLLTLNTSNTVLSMHARKDAMNMAESEPTCAIDVSPCADITFVTLRKTTRRQEAVNKKLSKMMFSSHGRKVVLETTSPSGITTKELLLQEPPIKASDVSLTPDYHRCRSSIYMTKFRPVRSSYGDKFRYLAQNYKCDPENFEDNCITNAKLAEEVGMIHQGAAWRMLQILFASDEVKVPFYNEDLDSIANVNPTNLTKKFKRADTYEIAAMFDSDTTESNPSEIEGTYSVPYNNREIDRMGNGDDPVDSSPSYLVTGDWDMKHEAFTHQGNFNTDNTEFEETSDIERSSVGECESYSHDNYQDSSVTRHSKAEMKMNFGRITLELLERLVNEGDVQTACSMVLVLEKRLERTLQDDFNRYIEEDVIVPWFYAYIDLLNRFQLWNIQAEIVARAPRRIQLLNDQRKSLIDCRCGRCDRMVRGGMCETCGPSSVCGVCNVSVKGLYLWCQGCAHGGHFDHISEWFEKFEHCPVGCGHRCEFV